MFTTTLKENEALFPNSTAKAKGIFFNKLEKNISSFLN